MLCAVDVGNTNIVLGICDSSRWVATWQLSADAKRTADEYTAILSQLFALSGITPELVDFAIMTNVVPNLQHTIEKASRNLFGLTPLTVGPGIKTGIKVRMENPREVGADRIVNAAAAYHIFKDAAIVIDIGTTTAFDCISKAGEYIGGAIAPGIGIAAEALFLGASRLSRIELDTPKNVIGKNTAQAMQSGLIFGYAELIDGMVARIRGELDPDAKVIATGNLAHIVAPQTRVITEVREELTLEGLRIIYELNR